MVKGLRISKIFLPLCLCLAIVFTVCVAAFKVFGGKSLPCDYSFYYVCYDAPPSQSSTASISELVHSYGGAGYIARVEGENYVVVSCYYLQSDADNVCNNLKAKGLNCSVICAKLPKRTLPYGARKNAKLYENTFNILFDFSKTCYNLANSIDQLKVGQEEAKILLKELGVVLHGVLKLNEQTCFKEELNYLIAEHDDISYGYIFSYGVRRLQIAVCDAIVNANIY